MEIKVPLKLTRNKQVLDSTKMSKWAEETTYKEDQDISKGAQLAHVQCELTFIHMYVLMFDAWTQNKNRQL